MQKLASGNWMANILGLPTNCQLVHSITSCDRTNYWGKKQQKM